MAEMTAAHLKLTPEDLCRRHLEEKEEHMGVAALPVILIKSTFFFILFFVLFSFPHASD